MTNYTVQVSGELYPVVADLGKIRVAYNWMYSALICDPSDDSKFLWNIVEFDDGTNGLMPAAEYSGMKLFASVRPDWTYYVQVQAPHSADWITAAPPGGDERMQMSTLGLQTVNFKGVNGSYVAVNPNKTQHDGRAAYRIQSNMDGPSARTNLFILAAHKTSLAKVPTAAQLGHAAFAEVAGQATADRIFQHIS